MGGAGRRLVALILGAARVLRRYRRSMTLPPPSGGYPAGPAPLRGTRPKEVEISFWLWITTIVLGVVAALITYPQIEQLQADAIDQALAQDPTLDRSSIESITAGALIGGIVIGLLFVVAELVFVFLMRGGRNWARIVLAVLGGLFVLIGLFGLVVSAEASSAIGLLQFLLLIGAIVTMFLPAANAWFTPHRPGL
ncbi:MAG: hypothetical protein ACRDTD_08075 [Pseudonocardiaceae bacterium]